MGARPGQSCTSRGCAACPPAWLTARTAPVSDPPRHLRSSPHPQHGLYPAYTPQPRDLMPLPRPAWEGGLGRHAQGGCVASPPARLTARPAPVSGPPRPLCTSPPPQHGLSPAYTPVRARFRLLVALHGGGGNRSRRRRLPSRRGRGLWLSGVLCTSDPRLRPSGPPPLRRLRPRGSLPGGTSGCTVTPRGSPGSPGAVLPFRARG